MKNKCEKIASKIVLHPPPPNHKNVPTALFSSIHKKIYIHPIPFESRC